MSIHEKIEELTELRNKAMMGAEKRKSTPSTEKAKIQHARE